MQALIVCTTSMPEREELSRGVADERERAVVLARPRRTEQPTPLDRLAERFVF